MTDVNIVEAAELFAAWRVKCTMKQQPFRPQLLERWHEQINYQGDNFDGFYVAAWRLMRCHPADRSNFRYVQAHLADSVPADQRHLIVNATFTDDVYSFRYYVLVHESCERALRMADMFAKRILAKGSLDPDGESLEDLRGVKAAWQRSKLGAKVRMCREAHVSIFAARRPKFPDGTIGLQLYQSINETDVEALELQTEEES